MLTTKYQMISPIIPFLKINNPLLRITNNLNKKSLQTCCKTQIFNLNLLTLMPNNKIITTNQVHNLTLCLIRVIMLLINLPPLLLNYKHGRTNKFTHFFKKVRKMRKLIHKKWLNYLKEQKKYKMLIFYKLENINICTYQNNKFLSKHLLNIYKQ